MFVERLLKLSLPPGGQETTISPRAVSFASMFRETIDSIDGSNWFGPGQPYKPTAPPGTLPRAFDYNYGVNYNLQPRTEHPGLASFSELRALADNCDLLREIIEHRKKQVVKIPWVIRPRSDPPTMLSTHTDRPVRNKNSTNIRVLTDFFERPDRQRDWTAWLSMALEEVFVIDALSIWPTYSTNGNLVALNLVDGATIKPLHDEQGWVPNPPNPAFQQYIKGTPSCNMTGGFCDTCREYRKNGQTPPRHPDGTDPCSPLIYSPRNPRTNKFYGFSPVEWMVRTILLAINRQTSQIAYYCYSDDTEVLTKRGWIKFQDSNSEDEFATRQISTGVFEWQRASEHFRKYYEGDMIHLTSKSLDLLVTPNHRMLVQRGTGSKSESVMSAEHLASTFNDDVRIPQWSVWDGQAVDNVVFDKSGPAYPVLMTGDEFCAFMGMYLAEGSLKFNSSGTKSIIQIHQPPDERGSFRLYADLLEQIFGEVPYHNGKGFEISRAGLVDYLEQFGHAHEKFIPSDIREATPRQLEIFWKYYYAGDGQASGDSGGTQQVFTVSRTMADQLVEIVQKMGRPATTWIRPAAEVVAKVPGQSGYRLIHRSEGYLVSRGVRATTSVRQSHIVEYSGDVVCVVVPNKFLYVRRNGKPVWSGNTEGNIPEMIVQAPNEWSRQEIIDFQAYFDTKAGDIAARRRMWFVPETKGILETKKEMLKDEMDEWLARSFCFAMGISPQPFIRMMNRATSQVASESAAEEGTIPELDYIKGWCNYIIRYFFFIDDVEFAWKSDMESDGLKQMRIDTGYVRIGVLGVDECREDLGLHPIGVGNVVITQKGAVPLSSEMLNESVDAINPQKAITGGDESKNADQAGTAPTS